MDLDERHCTIYGSHSIQWKIFTILINSLTYDKFPNIEHRISRISLMNQYFKVPMNLFFQFRLYYTNFHEIFTELAQRLDYVLQAVGIGRNYLYSVTAHTAYWNNCDVAYFVLTKLFPGLETWCLLITIRFQMVPM